MYIFSFQAFFIIRLHSEQAAASLPPIVDKDPVVLCDIMDRENFLKISKAKCYEFSSVRRTKFSTMALLYELHIQGQERFICNNCQMHVERKYHCIICDVSRLIFKLLNFYCVFIKISESILSPFVSGRLKNL